MYVDALSKTLTPTKTHMPYFMYEIIRYLFGLILYEV